MANVDEPKSALLHDLLASGFSARGEPDVTAAQGGLQKALLAVV